jgi:hypothetical protein
VGRALLLLGGTIINNPYPNPNIITETIHIVISDEYEFLKYQITMPDITKNTILSIRSQSLPNFSLIALLLPTTELTVNAIENR